MTPKLEDWVYLAGIIDGEGSIQIDHHPPYNYNVKLSVVNTDRRLLDWIVDRWPAPVHSYERVGQKRTYQWSTSNAYAASVIKGVRPYLTIKREQADLAIEFLACKTNYRGHTGIPDDELETRQRFAASMKGLRKVQL